MKYYSTNNIDLRFSFKDAVVMGLAPDKGLFFPVEIPKLPIEFFDNLHNMSLAEIGYEVLKQYVADDISDKDLKDIMEQALNFDIPLKEVEENVHVLELFHGPTCAFKDVGARFMARCLSHFVRNEKQKITVLVATSGDTGSAVANGFYKVDGIDVVILYPSGKVSDLQEKQLTTLGENITALEIDGVFDDCQALVKQAFVDDDLKQSLQLTSANSINIARLLPQSIYFYHAVAQLKNRDMPTFISVPSGNYGNLSAGLLANRSGLKIDRFIASSNINKIVPEYLASGIFAPTDSQQTVANAMDVGDPSNFARMLEIYQHKHELMQEDIAGFWFSDEQIKGAIAQIYKSSGYTLDPHGAVAYLGLKVQMHDFAGQGIFFETAHPAKFSETVEPEIGKPVETPNQLLSVLDKEKVSIKMSKNYSDFKEYLLSK